MGISRQELAAMEAADREIEETFRMTQEEFLDASSRDRKAKTEKLDNREQNRTKWRKDYYRKNREKLLEYQREYRKTHKEEKARQNKAYKEAHRESISAWGKAYYQANKEKIDARTRAYNQANREKVRAYHRERYRKKKAERDGKAGALRAVRVLAQGERGQGGLENVPEVVPADA